MWCGRGIDDLEHWPEYAPSEYVSIDVVVCALDDRPSEGMSRCRTWHVQNIPIIVHSASKKS